MSPTNPTPEADAGPGPAGPGDPRPRILLVDDDPINQTVAINLLRRHGWEAVAAANGKVALELLAQQCFGLILMDLQMPEMDGFQTTTAIRQKETEFLSEPTVRQTTDAFRKGFSPSGGRIPIIALTTASHPGVRDKCLAAGMDDFLNKPVNPQELRAMIEKYLSPGPQPS
jgi:two-component system, sensor histidine kinase and response regulator